VLIHVQDSGRGIAADQIERIFAPFVRIDTGYARTTEGTGLGLAISRDLARAMGGDLTATSELGEGSTFTLRLRKRAPES
jgi:signal transduction histidine kinase